MRRRDALGFQLPDRFLVAAVSTALALLAPAAARAQWTPPQLLTPGGIEVPELAVDADGDVTAAWPALPGGAMVARRPAGRPWEAARKLDAETAVDTDMTLAVTPDGNATALFKRGNEIRAAWRPRSGEWTVSAPMFATGASIRNAVATEDRQVVASFSAFDPPARWLAWEGA